MGVSGGPYTTRDSSLILNLDASDNNSYPGTGTVWTDLSGYGYNGTLTNGPTFNVANGGSIVFDGTNDYVNLGNPFPFTSSFTTSYFFRTTNSAATSRVIIGMYNGSGADWWTGVNGSNRLNFSFGAPVKLDISSSVSVIDGSWRQATCVYDKSVNSIYLYMNATLQSSNTSVTPTVNQPGGNLMMGTFGSALGFYYLGNVANYQIYNRALSITEITQNYEVEKTRFGL